MLAHGRATSTSLAPSRNSTGDGSNHSASASFALATASPSVSPAEPQPGSSGNTADQRRAEESNSTSNRSFIRHMITETVYAGKAEPFSFDQIYGGWWKANVSSDAKAEVTRSVQRYLRAIAAAGNYG